MAHYTYAIPDDFEPEQDGYLTVLFCVPNSRGWRGLITAHIESLTYGRLWDKHTGTIRDAQSIGREIFNSMAICDLETQLDRIATALENIESKAIERYTYEEFIEDLEDAFGIGSIVVSLVDGIIGLMPNLKAKIDFTPLALSVWETFTRWRPLHAGMIGINASLAAIAAAQATGKILGIIGTVLQAVDVIGNGWKDFIFGDKNVWDNIIKPIWDAHRPTAEGGTGGDSPDTDPTNRINVQTTNKLSNSVNVSITTCCYDIGDHPANDVEELEQEDLVTPPETWEGTIEQYNEYKCKAAYLLTQSYIEYLENVAGIESLIAAGTVPALLQLFTSTQILPLIFAQFVLAAGPLLILSYLITVLAAGGGLAAAILTYASNLEDELEDVVCNLYNSLTVTDARDAIETWMTDNLPVALPSSWIDAHIEHWYPANVLNALFEEYQVVIDYDIGENDCTSCRGDCTLGPAFGRTHTITDLGDLDYSVDAEFIFGTVYAAEVIWSDGGGRRLDSLQITSGSFTSNGVIAFQDTDGINHNSSTFGYYGADALTWLATFLPINIHWISLSYSPTDYVARFNFSGDCIFEE